MGAMPDEFVLPDWDAPAVVRALTTTRAGGASRGPYAGRNLALHVGDDPDTVRHNRRALTEALHLPAEPAWLEQVHGADVVRLRPPPGGRVAAAPARPRRADAAFTTDARCVCCVLTADCLPVLICDADGTRVAAAHAGWRGLVGGVIEATVAALSAERLMAWLGPAVSQPCYEVGDEVRAASLRRFPEAADAFLRNDTGRWQADLYAIARAALARAGVERVYGGEYCTARDADRFFSHRREAPCGRMASLIWLQSG